MSGVGKGVSIQKFDVMRVVGPLYVDIHWEVFKRRLRFLHLIVVRPRGVHRYCKSSLQFLLPRRENAIELVTPDMLRPLPTNESLR